MIRLVNDYLVQHKSFSIPGVGTIYIERTPAQSDFVNKQLLPPAYHYRFDKYFDVPEKDFFLFLSQRSKIEEYEAIRSYNEWAGELRASIDREDGSMLEGIGILKRAATGDIAFEPEGQPKSFDIPVPAERVIHSNATHHMLVGDKETTNTAMSEYLHEAPPSGKTSWWLYVLLAAVVVAIAAMIYVYANNGTPAPQ